MKFTALWLCMILIAVFGLQLIVGTQFFVLDKSLVLSEPWRILTAIFAHGSIGHLLSNLFGLGLFGLILEGRIGPKKVLGLFLFGGIIVNIFSIYDKSLGASGAIYAILGCLVVLRPMLFVWVFGVPMPMILAGVVWLVQDSIGLFLPTGIGNAAHISGLFIGIVYGIFLWKKFGDRFQRKKRDEILEKSIDEWEDMYMSKHKPREKLKKQP